MEFPSAYFSQILVPPVLADAVHTADLSGSEVEVGQ